MEFGPHRQGGRAPLYGDLGGLDRVAREIESLAARVRAAADEHHRRVHQVRWVSSAAEAYRGIAGRDNDHAHAVAERLLAVATSLREHAASARETSSLIVRLDDVALQFFRQVIAWVR